MAKQSLFSACKRVFRDGISGTYTVGTKDIFLELYGQDDIDNNNEIGNSSEENIVVVAGDTITIPSDYTLTPIEPKKSLVIICNNLINNGTISMYQKAPNVLPHDLFIASKQDYGGRSDIIIPAYANNATTKDYSSSGRVGADGNNGTNRNCGAGGTGSSSKNNSAVVTAGSAYAFGGGAGSGGFQSETANNVDTVYPMIGSDAVGRVQHYSGGVGNPAGENSFFSGSSAPQNFGCGGRIIIFCCKFTNNGSINVNGTATKKYNDDGSYGGSASGYGGASGAGAVDLFYTTLIEEGTITAEGGGTFTLQGHTPGKGGNGSITLTEWSKNGILKPTQKYMSKANMIYFLTEYISRLKQGED